VELNPLQSVVPEHIFVFREKEKDTRAGVSTGTSSGLQPKQGPEQKIRFT
jgi:hypothetical protein